MDLHFPLLHSMKKKKKKEKCTRVVGSRRVRQDYGSRSIIDKTTTGILGEGKV